MLMELDNITGTHDYYQWRLFHYHDDM